MKDQMTPFIYSTCVVPSAYACARCHAHGVKLWRQYNTFVANLDLLCSKCADPNFVLAKSKTDQITDKGGSGSLVPAVPTEDGESFWGYTAVPGAACAWWRSLPDFVGDAAKPYQITDEEKAADQAVIDARQRRNDDCERWRRETVYVIEATDHERFTLWEKYAGCRFMGGKQLPPFEPATLPHTEVKWEQIMVGELATVGAIYKRPVCVLVQWARILGKIVMFYHPTSRMVDWDMVKAWLSKEYPAARQCDAQNFHSCLRFLRDGN